MLLENLDVSLRSQLRIQLLLHVVVLTSSSVAPHPHDRVQLLNLVQIVHELLLLAYLRAAVIVTAALASSLAEEVLG